MTYSFETLQSRENPESKVENSQVEAGIEQKASSQLVESNFDTWQPDPPVTNTYSPPVFSESACSPGQSGGASFQEKVNQAAAVGPYDAFQAKSLSDTALDKAQKSGLPGPHNGPQDAIRHCDWSCEMAQTIGPEQAQKVGDIHEACGNNPPGEKAMDLHNNAVGRELGSKAGVNCEISCKDALEQGKLQDSDIKEAEQNTENPDQTQEAEQTPGCNTDNSTPENANMSTLEGTECHVEAPNSQPESEIYCSDNSSSLADSASDSSSMFSSDNSSSLADSASDSSSMSSSDSSSSLTDSSSNSCSMSSSDSSSAASSDSSSSSM